jgi:hypothetical protein
MTAVPPLSPPVNRRRHTESIWLGAVVSSAGIAAGTAVALWTLPTVPTPTNVATLYLEAQYAHDWPTAWSLMCEPTQNVIGGYQAFADGLDYVSDIPPSDVDIDVRELHVDQDEYGPAAAVSFTASSVGRDGRTMEDSGELFLHAEDGAARVCDKGWWG